MSEVWYKCTFCGHRCSGNIFEWHQMDYEPGHARVIQKYGILCYACRISIEDEWRYENAHIKIKLSGVVFGWNRMRPPRIEKLGRARFTTERGRVV
jgi:hypothetical protein